MSNKYCGPFAVAHVLGVPIKDATRKMREVSGKTQIHGFSINDMDKLFHRCYERTGKAHLTVEQWANARTPAQKEGRSNKKHILHVKKHYIVMDGDWIYDTFGCGKIGNHSYRRQWVKTAWEA